MPQTASRTKYRRIADLIQRRIATSQLRPGDPLPSERQLAGELQVSCGSVRSAYDALFRCGLVDRQQGRGTFVADPADARAATHQSRLGLLAVDMDGYESPFLRHLTYEIQRLARTAGYELVIDQLDVDDLVAGRMPSMIARRSVDGFFMYGRVRDFHLRYLSEQPLPHMLVGNRPVSAEVAQATIDCEGMGYQLTRMLQDMGRTPIWLDVDPSNTDYESGQAMLRGYTRAIHEAGGGPLHLCAVRMNQIDQVVERLSRTDLSRAAYIVQNWAACLLMTPLSAHCAGADQLLFAPMPSAELAEALAGVPNVIHWTRRYTIRDLATPAFEQLLGAIEGKRKQPWSVRLDVRCATVDEEKAFSLDIQPCSYRPGAKRSQLPAAPAGDWMG